MKEITQALLDARKEFGIVTKSSSNPFFNSKYADLNEIISAVEEALINHGIIVVQFVGNAKGESNGTPFLLTTLFHTSGERLECGGVPLVGATDMQKLGSAITYARRYALQAALMLKAEDDDGNAASQHGAYRQYASRITKMDETVLERLRYLTKQGHSKDKLAQICADVDFNNTAALDALPLVEVIP